MNFEDNTVKAQRVTMLMSDFILKINIYILWTYVTCKEKSILKISTLTLFKFSNERPVCKNPGKMEENCILFVVWWLKIFCLKGDAGFLTLFFFVKDTLF